MPSDFFSLFVAAFVGFCAGAFIMWLLVQFALDVPDTLSCGLEENTNEDPH